MTYGYKKQLNISFEEAVTMVKKSLPQQGFGVLTELDVKATLKQKLSVDFDNYVILGACNPPLAYQALHAERDIGLFLPCNIVIYEQDNTVWVSAIIPTVAMSSVQNDSLGPVAMEAEIKLKNVIDNL
ncbi:hypothetical protein COT97_00655 [Candidatus Falkowbacteria bacterium CG10_big_fil_rev_8_21_14_0_10_39_11]|uniref:DUF302 domain-containing protein n=1 Tax=Candidatus Falkowbacteria bacterium CG10_big_fil_rev_8_21_14_0_10_39_11 TaxID=1974565 RepID=A0A2H0V680_9BACT|nr:MAG: hypothetical protein COT97_00655 [Candidatus Falkowbacteria bacterium CG10_big_fil_rev_8_21_14_0_10_39_11]